MDQWACDRRDMRVNDPRERIAAAACESLIRKTTCFAGLNFTTLKLRILRAALEALEKAEVELNLLNYASKSFARDRKQKIAQGLRNAIYKCRPGSLFVKALQRIADLLDKGRRISQFFAENLSHGEKLSRISPRRLCALPQGRSHRIEKWHFFARLVHAAQITEPGGDGKAQQLDRSFPLQLLF